MKNFDLFGGETQAVKWPTLKGLAGYRKATELEKIAGKVCRDCKNMERHGWHTRTYTKCVLIGTSHSEATDIALSGTCPKFEQSVLALEKKLG